MIDRPGDEYGFRRAFHDWYFTVILEIDSSPDSRISRVDPVVFLHPSLHGLPSGGNQYNRRMIDMAERRGLPLQSVIVEQIGPASVKGFPPSLPVPAELAKGEVSRLRLWDSLLLARYAALPPSIHRSRDALLMHYLPSLNPLLDTNAQSAARDLEDRAACRVRCVIATGRLLAGVLRSRYPDIELFVCEPGVDQIFASVAWQRRGQDGGEGPVDLLSVANLVPAKGYVELLAMLKEMPQMNWRWHMVGSSDVDPEFAQEFMRRARSFIAAGRIVVHGVLDPPSLAQLMAGMEIFVCPSHFESYGMAVAEAVAAGLPVVATDVGEVNRLIRNDRDGYVLPVGCWRQFASRLAELIVNPERRRAFRAARVLRVRSWEEAFADFATACCVIQGCGER